ncbi:hypothetical protein SG34_000875 [Thalassomonas viridans]|uniref:Uncharacterized protein n=1 Tax=Thalassomonas viridans TaxID=137584 RepID=A0AAF0C9R7_9GAMM|nr:hypothetical protein [Thalassomonas viridans]WDE05535.1 hypothetical protein SG34_000875 [Thalassomonas viridans]
MELKVNKKKLANLSRDLRSMPMELTAAVAGGTSPEPGVPEIMGGRVRVLTKKPTEYHITH